MSSKRTPVWILAGGLAFVFLYFGIDKFIHPLIWIGWIPKWMDGFAGASQETWLRIVGVIEIIAGAALVFPLRLVQRFAAALAGIQIIGVLTQTGWNDIAVRDIGLLTMAVALWFLLGKQK